MLTGEKQYSTLAKELRCRVNESDFVCSHYLKLNEKNLWGCICSAMDWIDVGVTYIENFIPPRKNGLVGCMEICSFIQAIDMVYTAIQRLDWVFFFDGVPKFKGRGGDDGYSSKFKDNATIFKDKDYNKGSLPDDKCFAEIRACCGVHPVDLCTRLLPEEKKQGQHRFASWIAPLDDKYFYVFLYSEVCDKDKVELKIHYSDLLAFFEERFLYLNDVIEKINSLERDYQSEDV